MGEPTALELQIPLRASRSISERAFLFSGFQFGLFQGHLHCGEKGGLSIRVLCHLSSGEFPPASVLC